MENVVFLLIGLTVGMIVMGIALKIHFDLRVDNYKKILILCRKQCLHPRSNPVLYDAIQELL
jgi:hypothetical protein